MKNGLAFFIGLSTLIFGACSSGSAIDQFSISTADVKILEETRALLSDESKWTRGEETQCNLDAEAFTLFCALQKASFVVIEDFHLRRPALEEVRYAIDALSENPLDRRLIDYNNLDATNLEDIHKVIDMALKRVQARLDASGA